MMPHNPALKLSCAALNQTLFRPSRTQIAVLCNIKHISVRNGPLFDAIAYTHLHSGAQIAYCCSRWFGKLLQKSSTR